MAASRSRANTDQNKFTRDVIVELNQPVTQLEPDTPCPFKKTGLFPLKRLCREKSQSLELESCDEPKMMIKNTDESLMTS